MKLLYIKLIIIVSINNMSDILAQILIFINSIDPYNMLQYGEPDIYIKEAKLLLYEKILTPGKVKDIFY